MQYPNVLNRSIWKPVLCTLAMAALAACGGGGGGAGPGATSVMGASTSPDGSASAASGSSTAATLRGSDVQVNTFTTGDQYGAHAARLADGGWVVAWSSYTGSGAANEVRLQRFDAQGQPVGGEQLVAPSGTYVQVAAFADGRFLVTWRNSPYIYTVVSQGQLFDAQGQALGAPIDLGTGFNNYSGRPMALPDGGFLFVASVNAGRYSETYSVVRRYAADGTPQGPGTQLNSDLIPVQAIDMNFAGNGSSALLADGRIAVAWTADGGAANSELRLSLFDGQANPLGTHTVLASEPGVSATSIVALPGGGYAVAWESGLSDQSRTAWLEVFDAAGQSLGRRQLATDPAAFYVTPQLAVLADGSLVASWRVVRYTSTSAERETWVQRLDASGAPTGAAEALPAMSTSPSGSAGSHAIVGIGGDQFMVVYGAWSAAQGVDVRAAFR